MSDTCREGVREIPDIFWTLCVMSETDRSSLTFQVTHKWAAVYMYITWSHKTATQNRERYILVEPQRFTLDKEKSPIR